MLLRIAVSIQCAMLIGLHSLSSSPAQAAVPAAAKSPTALLDQVLKAYGGAEKVKEHRMHPIRTHALLSSTSGISAAENSYECDFLEKDGKARIEMTMLGVPLIIGFDGKKSWQQYGDWVSPAGESTTEVIADELKHGIAALSDALDPKAKLELVPAVSIQGKSCPGLKVTTASGSVTTYYVDPVSHLVLRSDYEGTDHELAMRGQQSIEYSDYRSLAGTMEPYRLVRFSGNRKKSELTVKSMDADVAIDDKAFVMPPESEIARLKDSPLVVPFEYSGNEILIRARMNGGPEQRFIVDTGSSQTVLDKTAAAGLGTHPVSSFSVTAGSRALPLSYTKIHSLTIGDVTFSDIPALVTDLSNIGEKPAGLIGANILRRFLVAIDFDERKLVLSDPRNVTVPPNATALPTKPAFGGTAMIIKGTLDDKSTTNFLVDTGASFNNLPQSLAKPIYPGTVMPVGQIFSVEGQPMSIGSLKVKSLKLGTLSLPGIVFTVAPDTNSNRTGLFTNSTMGILGNPIWSQFKTIVDYRNERLILEPQTSHQKYVRLIGELEQVDTEFLKSKNEDDALKAYEKILVSAQVDQLKAVEGLAIARMADMYVQKYKKSKEGKVFEQAIQDYDRALKIANQSLNRTAEGEILASWALAYLEAKRSYAEVTQAQALLAKALQKAPTDPRIFSAFGTTLLKVGKREEAEKLLDRTLVLDPSNWQALWAKYELYQLDKRPKDAALIVEQLQYYYPTFPDVIALAPPAVKPSVASIEKKPAPAPAVKPHRKHR